MIYSNYSFKTIGAGVLLSFYCATPVLAEDIEIYNTLGAGVTDIQPNVLFVLDTSGSMSNNSITISEEYDSATTYADAGCGSNRIYWNRSGSPPGCGSDDYFNSSALNCDRALSEYDGSGTVISTNGPLSTQGFYADNIAQKRGSTWSSIRTRNSSQRDYAIECETDQGVHGSVASPTPNTYIEDSSTAWDGTESISSWPGRYYTIYTSNYMNYLANPNSNRTITRFQAVKEAIATIVETSNDINIGLMGFNGYGGSWDGSSSSPHYDGGQVRFAMEDIATARQPLIDFVLDPGFTTNSWTPLSETYFEAIHYFKGDTPPYGTSAYSSPSSVAASLESDGTYLSPITNECQNNYIVFLTDGDPTRDTLSTAVLGTLPGFTDMSCASTNETTSEGNQAIIESNCLDRLSQWAYNNDISSDVAGNQKIVTNTIGFGDGLSPFAIQMLERTAVNGGGAYFEAQNPNDLINAFTQSISAAQTDNTTFSSPAVSVNAFNRSVNLNDLYFTLFQPAAGPHWPGNLKKYKLGFVVDPDDATKQIPQVQDSLFSDAIAANGTFDEAAVSYWSNFVDGEDITDGGAAGEFAFRTGSIPAMRNVYTYTGSYNNANGVFTPATSGSLTNAANSVVQTNTAITESMLNIAGLPPTSRIPGTTPLIETLLDWASGLDAIGTPGTSSVLRTEMGDPLHSQPALVSYGTTAAAPELVAYMATNDGYLHAINTDDEDGSEIFSFIPQELLPNLNELMEDTGNDKIYGLDGDVVVWFNDIPDGNGVRDGIVNGSDTVYLYVGMRRGGNNIYSLDVTDRSAPVLRWVIKGGFGDYAELGQTWSSINVEKVKDAASTYGSKTVLMFGGGYDTSQDNVTVRTPDNVGRAVYIADAITGTSLWQAGPGGTLSPGDMDYSIPARVKPLDLSGDGNIDRLYVPDMGGQIFRFDIDESSTNFAPGSITGGRIADLSDTASTTGNRRFYYPPDVALIAERGKAAYLALSISSGYRAHPNNVDIQDRIYMLRDSDIYTAPSTYVTITESDLYNATANIAGGEGLNADGTDNGQAAALATLNAAANKGWYVYLDDETTAGNWVGEKGLSETLIIEGSLIATTYVPFDPSATPTSTNSCTANSAGTGKVFFMKVTDATPLSIADTDERPGRHLYDLEKSGIPSSPRLIITEEGDSICFGPQCESADMVQGIRRTFWYEAE